MNKTGNSAAYLPTEEEEQILIFEWAKIQKGAYPELRLLYHIANEGKRSVQTGSRLKAAGLSSGVPDICLPVARGGYNALYIELKRQKGGRLSENQKKWLSELNAAGNLAVRCDGFDEAVRVILRYLKGERCGFSTIGEFQVS